MRKYQITFHDRPASKARYRQALKMMGAENVRIEEAEVEPTTPKPKRDDVPTSPEALAVAELFNRKPNTPWADEEIKAFKAAVKSTLLNLENITLVATFYRSERKTVDHHCRTSVLTFCRHFGTELDKVRSAKPQASKAFEWADSRPKLVALPDPLEAERIAAEARKQAEEFRKTQNERTA